MSYIKKILLLPLFVQICIGTVFGIEQNSISNKSQCNSCDKSQELEEELSFKEENKNESSLLSQDIQQIVVIPFSANSENIHKNSQAQYSINDKNNSIIDQQEFINITTWNFFSDLINKKFPPYYIEFNSFKNIQENIHSIGFDNYQLSYLTDFSGLKVNYSQFYSQLILIP